MDHNNIQTQIVLENKQKIRAKWFLIILLLSIVISSYLLNNNLFFGDCNCFSLNKFFKGLDSFKRKEFIELFIFGISSLMFLLPSFVSYMFYKKGRYIKEIIWGVLLFIITQFVAGALLAVFFTCLGCYNSEYINSQVVVPLKADY